MSLAETIVTQRKIAQLFAPVRAAVRGISGDVTEGVPSHPGLTNEQMDRLNEALAELKKGDSNPVLTTPRHQLAALLQSHLAKKATDEQKLAPLDVGQEVQFSNADWLRWLLSFFTWIEGIQKHDLTPPPTEIGLLPDQFRLAILGDWGTGLYGAPVCTRSIEDDPDGFQMILHLGDVYYSGTREETAARLFAFWPKVQGAVSRGLNGNHEMFTGGHSYFEDVLPHFNQATSYFAYQNSNWFLVFLDTAYQDHDLTQEQLIWLNNVLSLAGNRKILFFSHHQPFSLLDQQGPQLLQKLNKVLEARRIFAWYWGHEHRCILYDQHPRWGFYGRCAGHSGFPYTRDQVPNLPLAGESDSWRRQEGSQMALPEGTFPDGTSTYDVPAARILDSPNIYIVGHELQYGPNGYLTLQFDGARMDEQVRAATGAILNDQILS